ncbi:large conductance mechanosensitive channel protein MscL [Malacoplasma penetrans]|nr:large conductance mechanosensitive channel protein MscL [Malacoplasma penetrans]
MKIKNPLKGQSWKEFKKLVSSRGNLIDLAVALIIGTAFTAIVTSLVNDIIMPLIGAAAGKSLSELVWYLDINNQPHFLPNGDINPQAIIIKYGNFLQVIINFFIIALTMFSVVKAYLSIRKSYKNKFYGFTYEEYFAFIKEGKKRKEIKLLAIERDLKLKEKEEKEKAEKEKNSVESILKDIRTIMEENAKLLKENNDISRKTTKTLR